MIPYNTIHETKADLQGLECWNLSRGPEFSIPAGTRIQVVRVYDATSTSVLLVDENGKGIPHKDNRQAYRFIVPNKELGSALGMDLPETTADPVGDIIRYESGEMDVDEGAEFLEGVRDSGMASQLQGSYGRAVQRLEGAAV